MTGNSLQNRTQLSYEAAASAQYKNANQRKINGRRAIGDFERGLLFIYKRKNYFEIENKKIWRRNRNKQAVTQEQAQKV